jgi:hypothetical protein
LNGSTARAAWRIRSSTRHTSAFRTSAFCRRRSASPGLKHEEVLEDHPPLRRRAEHVQRLDRRRRLGEVRLPQRGAARRPRLAIAKLARHRIEQLRRQRFERLPHEPPLHVRGHAPRPLVDGHDASGVNRRRFVRLRVAHDDLELRIRDLHPARSPVFDFAVEHDLLMRADDVFQEGLIGPDRLHLAAAILHERGEETKAGPTGGLQTRVQHFPADRRGLTGFERNDGLKTAAIFVAERKTKQQIFDGEEAGLLQVGGLARPDALQILQRHLEDVVRHQRRCYCTITARASPTSMRRISAGSVNGSSMLMPLGKSSFRE